MLPKTKKPKAIGKIPIISAADDLGEQMMGTSQFRPRKSEPPVEELASLAYQAAGGDQLVPGTDGISGTLVATVGSGLTDVALHEVRLHSGCLLR